MTHGRYIHREIRSRSGVDWCGNLNDLGEVQRENAALRMRLSRMSEASLRINESLDLNSVLQGVLDSARSLTDARYALITTLDESGGLEDFLVSGLTAEESQQLWSMPEGLRFFEYLSRLSGPLRVADFAGHARTTGLPDFRSPVPVTSFLAVPIRHREDVIGNIHVARSEPGVEFSHEDEETLVMFASQAALVIANARRYRDERRAKADLEALIETSPVGVAVLGTTVGRPVSFNQEAARILDGLRTDGCPVEQLLEILIVHREDGRELSLEELTVAEALSTGETIRAEEVMFRVPDGRSVKVLMNATPIRSSDGLTESFVVTLQDLTPLDELERSRAEFLGIVSHELRAPLASIKGSAATLVGSSASLDPAEMLLFFQMIDQQADQMSGLITDLLDMARIDMGRLSVVPVVTEPSVLVDQARNLFLGGGGRENVEIDVELDLPLVMADRRRIVQVLGNLLSNAARNSPDVSPVRIVVRRENVHVLFSVSDKGRGLSADILPKLFRKFSRVEGDDWERSVGGSGLGLAICKGIVDAHGGRIWAESDGPGLGASFTFTLPAVTGAHGGTLASSAGTNVRQQAYVRERMKILLVDDDPGTLRYVRETLSGAEYETVGTGDPERVGSLLEEEKPDLVLLDLMLPGTTGIELIERVPGLADLPLIFLSAYGADGIIVRALEAGADDYIVKPFSPTELVARVRTVLNRWSVSRSTEPTEPYRLSELTVDYRERRVFLGGTVVSLTDLEYRVLYELSVNAGLVLSHADLLRRAWGRSVGAHSGRVRTVVKNLRRKLGDDAYNPTYIFNELRVGYRMPKGESGVP